MGTGAGQGLPPRPIQGPGGKGTEQGLSAHLHVVNAFGLRIHHEEAVIKVLFGPPPVGQGQGPQELRPPPPPMWLPQRPLSG